MSDSTHPDLPIDPHHVARQFARRGDLGDAAFLYAEIDTRMRERLRYIRLEPARVLDAGCAVAAGRDGLAERFPAASYVGIDHCAALIAQAEARHAGPGGVRGLLQRLRPGGAAAPEFHVADLAATGLAPESVQLVWSNLALHWHPTPHAVLGEWRRVLAVGGLAMFSCLGPATLREVRAAVEAAGLQTQTLPFVDMHDFGDILIESGFDDPVMDQETLTLTYSTPERLLADVRALGGNPARGRRAGLAGRAFRDRLHAALEAQRQPDGLLHLTLEVAYGHAWRAASRQAQPGETRISVSAIGRGPRP
ncbi:methyltransferase domain-containing protein [Achromobacter sp. GG226]|uniref:methyltransferase domain-containing protein n=1 Tax=Verticiella alkaliphila TaxID=2779529 RepID=UPI001C0D357C|nr:methyltransferase domain-containing protein [Verticiella sp. GG226]MBU4610389.1 methyltransferase domain-containing protein [Verticiella sp. GG226]